MKTEKFSAENKWRQTQFNEKMEKYGKSKLKKYCKIQSPWPIGVPTWLFYGWQWKHIVTVELLSYNFTHKKISTQTTEFFIHVVNNDCQLSRTAFTFL
jgi:hypothetical protein